VDVLEDGVAEVDAGGIPDDSLIGVDDGVVLDNGAIRLAATEQEAPVGVLDQVVVDAHIIRLVDAGAPEAHHLLAVELIVAHVGAAGANQMQAFAEADDDVVLDDAVAAADLDALRRFMRPFHDVVADHRALAVVHDRQGEAAVIGILPSAEHIALDEGVPGVAALQLNGHAGPVGPGVVDDLQVRAAIIVGQVNAFPDIVEMVVADLNAIEGGEPVDAVVFQVLEQRAGDLAVAQTAGGIDRLAIGPAAADVTEGVAANEDMLAGAVG